MIETLARKRMHLRLSHLTALAVIAALIGAMFVSFGPARAATGDVSANVGYCVQAAAGENGLVRATTAVGGDLVTVEVPDRGDTSDAPTGDDAPTVAWDDDANPDLIEIPCNAAFAGRPVTVTPAGGRTPVVTVANPSATVSVVDSDGIVKAGGADLTVRVSIKNLVQFTHNATLNEDDDTTNNVVVASSPVAPGTEASPADQATAVSDSFDTIAGARVLWVRVSGELADPATPTAGWVGGTVSTTLPIPAGTTAGDYTISAAVIYDPNTDSAVTDDDRDGSSTDEDSTVLIATKKITVGEPGIDASSVSLALGNASEDNPLTTLVTGKGELIPEDGTEPANGGDIYLKVTALNSLGNPSNDASLTTMTVIAPGGSISIFGPNARRTAPGAMVTNGIGSNSASATTAAEVKSTMFILVSKADKKPGTVDVYTLIIGTDGAPRSDTLTLTFTGASSSLELGNAKPVAPNKWTEFTINANDAAGNPGSVGQLIFSVTGPDGNPVGQGENSKLGVTKSTAGSSTPDEEADDNPLQTVGLVKTMAATAPGVYTVKVSLAGVADSEATTDVIVSGIPASISVEADKTEVELNDIVTVMATVTDKNDAPVADGTEVTWGTFGELTLTRVSAEKSETKDGKATAQFGVSKGTGAARITAISGAASGSVPVTGPAAADTEEEPEVVSLDCLSSLTGFSSYTCGVGSSASELFGLLDGRGATAIHLWNGSMWVRYAVVDGSEIPGSSDFAVTEDDILYISN